MSNKSLLTILSLAIVSAIGLSAQPASAMPCCSICPEFPNLCKHGCSFACGQDDDAAAPGRVVYDEAAGLCYVASGP